MPSAPGEERGRLISLLCAIPTMASPGGREFVLEEVSQESRFDLHVGVSPQQRVDCIRIIDAAMGLPGGLQRLANVMWLVDRSDSSRAFLTHVQRWHPNEFLSVKERLDLLRDLGPHVQQDELGAYYRIAAREPVPRQFEDLDDLLREVEQLPWHEPGHPLVRLTEAIANRARARHVKETAEKWSDLLAGRIGDLADDRGAERQILAQLRSSKTSLFAIPQGRPTLMLQLDPPPPSPERYHFTAWLSLGDTSTEKIDESEDGQPLTLPSVRKRLGDVITNALIMADQVHQNTSELDLEFILPRNLLCVPIEEWTNLDSDYMSLGVQFVVVVRDLLRQNDMQRLLPWRRKWTRVLQDMERDSGLCRWVTCSARLSEPGQVYYEFLNDECVSLGLTFQPGSGAHVFELAEALDAGMPIAIWPRQCEHSDPPVARDTRSASEEFRQKLIEQLAGKRLTDLPKIVLELRKAAAADPSKGLTLLWDDPTRRPRPDSFNLDAPTPFRP